MDQNSEGRSWMRNIYHKFEAICQDVDDFVTKDTVEYVENQVQTVGEGMKKIYSNVVLDFQSKESRRAKTETMTITENDTVGNDVECGQSSDKESSKEQDGADFRSDLDAVDNLGQFSTPPSVDSAQSVTVSQNDNVGNNIEYGQSSDEESSKEQDGAGFRSCDPDARDNLGQFSTPPSTDSAQSVTVTQNDTAGNNIKCGQSSDEEPFKEEDRADFRSHNPNAVENLGHFSSPPSADSAQVVGKDLQLKEISNGSILYKKEMVPEENVEGADYLATNNLNFHNGREQHRPSDNVEVSPGFIVKVMELRTSGEDNMECSNRDHSEEAETDLFSEQEGETIFEKSEIFAEEHVSVEEQSTSEHASYVEAEYFWGFLWTQEQPDCYESYALEGRGSTWSGSVDNEKKSIEEIFTEENVAVEEQSTSEHAIWTQQQQDCYESSIDHEKKSIQEIFAEESVAVEEQSPSEHAISLEAKNFWELLWTREQSDCCESYALESKSSPKRCSVNDEKKSIDLGKCPPEMSVSNAMLRMVPVEHQADSNPDPDEEGCVGSINRGTGLKENVRKENLVVYRSYSSLGSSSNNSFNPREEHPEADDSNSLLDENFCVSLQTSKNEDNWSTILAKSSPEISDEGFTASEEDEERCNRPSCSDDTESDVILDDYCSCTSSNFDIEENGFGEKHTAPEVLDCSEHGSLCDLCSSKPHEEPDEFNSQNGERSSSSSLIETQDHRNTTPAPILLPSAVKDEWIRASLKEETICNSLSDILSMNISPELVSSDSCLQLQVAQTESSSSTVSTEPLDLLELPQANSSPEQEEIYLDYTDSSDFSLSVSNIPCASFSGNTALDQMPAFPKTTSSAEIFDDSVNYTIDAEMETINLSDEAKVEDSCAVVDNELLHAVSYRPRRFRSYKFFPSLPQKLIWDAFGSRKRLIKEYEQLSIQFVDIEADTSFHSEQFLASDVPSASRSSQAHDLGESDWVLL